MAFDIGQRVTNRYMGDGTVTGELQRVLVDSATGEVAYLQEVTFDNPILGVKLYQVGKLSPLFEGVDDATQA